MPIVVRYDDDPEVTVTLQEVTVEDHSSGIPFDVEVTLHTHVGDFHFFCDFNDREPLSIIEECLLEQVKDLPSALRGDAIDEIRRFLIAWKETIVRLVDKVTDETLEIRV